jgi:hypothetical protein
MRFTWILPLVSAVLVSLNLHAHNHNNIDETKRLMKLNEGVTCSFQKEFLLQTKDGLGTTDPEPATIQLFRDLKPEASSPSDFATYSLSWENSEYSFYYFMNSQIGEIRIVSKVDRLEANSDLDISDMAKSELKLGEVRLVQSQDVTVTHPFYGKQVPGELVSTLSGSCRKKK